jgi:hypothetical protein
MQKRAGVEASGARNAPERKISMKPMKLAEVRKHTGCQLTVEEAAQYVSPSQSYTVTRNQACALSVHSWLNSATDWLRLEACLVLLAHKRRQKKHAPSAGIR